MGSFTHFMVNWCTTTWGNGEGNREICEVESCVSLHRDMQLENKRRVKKKKNLQQPDGQR